MIRKTFPVRWHHASELGNVPPNVPANWECTHKRPANWENTWKPERRAACWLIVTALCFASRRQPRAFGACPPCPRAATSPTPARVSSSRILTGFALRLQRLMARFPASTMRVGAGDLCVLTRGGAQACAPMRTWCPIRRPSTGNVRNVRMAYRFQSEEHPDHGAAACTNGQCHVLRAHAYAGDPGLRDLEMPRTPNMRTDNVHVKVQKYLKDQLENERADAELVRAFGDQRVVEGWVESILATRTGPENVLRVFYEDGTLTAFLKVFANMEERSSGGRSFAVLKAEKIRVLENLDNGDERYYRGKLPGNVKLIAEGKNQLFLSGGGALEIALRAVVGKRFIEKVHEVFVQEKLTVAKYNTALEEERGLSTDHFNAQVMHLVETEGMPIERARATIRRTAKVQYGALVQNPKIGFKSATDAVLVAKGDLDEDDAMLCGQGRENDVSIGKQALRQKRDNIKNVGNYGTRLLHSHTSDMRYRSMRLMVNYGLSAANATQTVADQAIKNDTYALRDDEGNIESGEEHAHAYFNKERDLEMFRKEEEVFGPAPLPDAGAGAPGDGGAGSSASMIVGAGGGSQGAVAAGSAVPAVARSDPPSSAARRLPPSRLQPPPPPLLPAGGSGPSVLGRRTSDRRQLVDALDDFDDVDPSQGSPSLLHTKKKQKQGAPAYRPPSVGASRADGKAPASGGSARASMRSCGGTVRTASHNEVVDNESEIWTPYLQVEGEISFAQIAKYLSSPEGVAWRQNFNIVHVATAKELLEW